MNQVKVFIVEDHAVVREALKKLIAGAPQFQVVGEAADGAGLVELCRSSGAEVVLMDLDLPTVDGISCTRALLEARGSIKVVALTAHEDSKLIRNCLAAGAKGYVFKRSVAQELLTALSVVAQGGAYIDNFAAEKLHNLFDSTDVDDEVRSQTLSDREEQVIKQVARGMTSKEIGVKLGISIKTVDTYKTRALEKLGLGSRSELIQYAVRCGWLSGTPGHRE